MFSFDEVRKLIDLVAEREIGSLELEHSGYRLRIVGRGGEPASMPLGWATAAAVPTPATATPVSGAETAEPEPEPAHPGAHVLKSPIVGTFYVAPSPDAEPYVRVGDRVSRGQVVCIVEAMKLMNEIEADTDGVVVQVFPDNAQPVEYGQPLFGIDPA